MLRTSSTLPTEALGSSRTLRLLRDGIAEPVALDDLALEHTDLVLLP
jgi:hypothetical protein